MSGDFPLLFEHIHGCNRQTLVYPLLQAELSRIMSQRRDRFQSQVSSECLLADMGDFLINILDITSDLATTFVDNHIPQHFDKHTKAIAKEWDLHTMDYFVDKQKALEYVLLFQHLNVCHQRTSLSVIASAICLLSKDLYNLSVFSKSQDLRSVSEQENQKQDFAGHWFHQESLERISPSTHDLSILLAQTTSLPTREYQANPNYGRPSNYNPGHSTGRSGSNDNHSDTVASHPVPQHNSYFDKFATASGTEPNRKNDHHSETVAPSSHLVSQDNSYFDEFGAASGTEPNNKNNHHSDAVAPTSYLVPQHNFYSEEFDTASGTESSSKNDCHSNTVAPTSYLVPQDNSYFDEFGTVSGMKPNDKNDYHSNTIASATTSVPFQNFLWDELDSASQSYTSSNHTGQQTYRYASDNTDSSLGNSLAMGHALDMGYVSTIGHASTMEYTPTMGHASRTGYASTIGNALTQDQTSTAVNMSSVGNALQASTLHHTLTTLSQASTSLAYDSNPGPDTTVDYDESLEGDESLDPDVSLDSDSNIKDRLL